MIVVDTSAIIAIHAREIDYQHLLSRLLLQTPRIVPATVVVEATMVLSRGHPNPKQAFDSDAGAMGLQIAPITEHIAVAAQEAFIRFGKGRHPAKLNLCDCFSYAAAKVLNAPLLYVGNDFGHTDITAA